MTMRTSLLSLGLAFVAACTPRPTVSSDDIATHGMSMQVDVQNDGSTTKLEVTLWVGNHHQRGTVVTLSPNDELQLTAPSAARLGVVGSVGDGKKYGTSFGPSDGPFVIDYKRAKGASALGNRVLMPPSFSLSGPTGTVPRKESLKVTWNRADGAHRMYLVVEGSCLDRLTKDIVGDPGEFVLNAGEIKPFTSSRANESCGATITVYRQLDQGEFSKEFGHASGAYAKQLRSISFTSAP